MFLNALKFLGFFRNRMLEFFSITQKTDIPISAEFAQDLNWFIKFLKDFNGITFFENTQFDASIELDANPTGLGGRWGQQKHNASKGPSL